MCRSRAQSGPATRPRRLLWLRTTVGPETRVVGTAPVVPSGIGRRPSRGNPPRALARLMRLRARLGRLRIRARAAEEDRSWNAEAGLGGAFLAALLLLAPPAAAPAASAQASRAAPASLQTQWTREGLPDHFVYHLAADPTRPGRLYAYGGLFGGKGRNTNMNLFRSDDGGQWENISQGNVGSIFAGGLAVDDSGVVYVSDSHSIHISRDGGSAWETVSGPPGDRALAVVPTEPPTLYTVGGLTGFARSTDGGVTW